MKRALAIISIILIFCLIVSPVFAKKDDNPADNSKFKHKNAAVTLSAYEILSNGAKGDKLNNNHPNMNSNKVVRFEALNGTDNKIKQVYVYRKSSVLLSNESDIIWQSSKFKNSPTLELYYSYQMEATVPWQYYYRVGDCDTTCNVLHADFLTRNLWVTQVEETTINALVDSEVIPAYAELP
jgi:methionine-rich copper-binding protein CopC